jgi:hypothetical protein
LIAGTASKVVVVAVIAVVVIAVVVFWCHSRPTGVSVCVRQAAHAGQRRLE